KGSKRCRRPGQWQRDSVQFHWAARALAWDVAVLAKEGQAVVVRFVAALEFATTEALTALALETTKPNSWPETLEAVKVLGAFIPHGAIQAVSGAQGG